MTTTTLIKITSGLGISYILTSPITTSNTPVDDYSLCDTASLSNDTCASPIRVSGSDEANAVYCTDMGGYLDTSRGVYLFVDLPEESKNASFNSTEFSIYRAKYFDGVGADFNSYST